MIANGIIMINNRALANNVIKCRKLSEYIIEKFHDSVNS